MNIVVVFTPPKPKVKVFHKVGNLWFFPSK